jgi:26S proteasome regulatory subunit N9
MSGGYVDRTAAAVEHCEMMATQHPDLAERFTTLGQTLKQKLWHQLTTALLEFLDDPSRGAHFGDLYHKIVQVIDSKLLPISVARMAVLTAQELAARQNDYAAAKAILENAMEKSKDAEASIYLASKHSLLILTPLLSQPGFAPGTDESKATLRDVVQRLKENEPILPELNDSIVSAAHYEAAVHYYKLVGPAQAFYESALSYLEHDEANPVLATDLALAALTADNVFNLTPALPHIALAPTYLIDLVSCIADGDISRYHQVTQQHQELLRQQPVLVNAEGKIDEKLRLTALVKLVLANPRRALSFDEIRATLQRDEIELLVMRAFAVGWLQGSIDQVDEMVEITYVEPAKALSKEQLQNLVDQFDKWATTVKDQHTHMHEQTSPSLFA